MLESESDTLRFVSSWHSDAETECDEDPDCVAIVKERLLLIFQISLESKLSSSPDKLESSSKIHNVILEPI